MYFQNAFPNIQFAFNNPVIFECTSSTEGMVHTNHEMVRERISPSHPSGIT